jgi:hypothetical protein
MTSGDVELMFVFMKLSSAGCVVRSSRPDVAGRVTAPRLNALSPPTEAELKSLSAV